MKSELLPKISIIVPNFNNEKYLPECISSIVNQTYSNIEIVVVDDCSTDNSWDVLQSLKEKHDNLIIYRNVINSGVSSSRNFGVKLSTGEYISTLDPDDVYYPDKIEKEYEVFKKHDFKDIVVYSGFERVDAQLRNPKVVIDNKNAITGNIHHALIYRAIAFSRDMLIKKEMFNHVGGFDVNMSLYEDWDFKIKLAKHYPYYFSGSKGMKYRKHGAGLSSVKYEKHLKSMNDIFLSHNPSGYLWLFNLINKRGLLNRVIRKLIFVTGLNKLFLIN